MRVLTILNELTIGGIQSTLLSCLPYLKAKGIQMSVCCFKKGGELESAYRAHGVDIVYIKKTGIVLYDAYQLQRLIKKEGYDIVHSRLSYTSGGFAKASKSAGIPFLLSIHNEFAATLIRWRDKPVIGFLRKRYLAINKKLTDKYSTLIIGHSQSNLKTNYPNWKDSDKFKILYNGIDLKKFSPTLVNNKQNEKKEVTIVHVGTFKEQKNYPFLLDCFSNLNPVKNNYRLILVGDGQLRPMIENKIEENGIKENVALVGFSNQVENYLKKADLFFFPSLFEGLANVIMEAQYMGLPICASRISPHYESTYKAYHQYFFDPLNIGEGTEKLSTMIGLIKNRRLNKEIEEAKQFVEDNFSIENMASKLAAIYKEMV